MVAYVRTVKTKSGAMAVQIVWSSRRGARSIEHVGSAHDAVELAALNTAAARRLTEGQQTLDFDVGDAEIVGAGSAKRVERVQGGRDFVTQSTTGGAGQHIFAAALWRSRRRRCHRWGPPDVELFELFVALLVGESFGRAQQTAPVDPLRVAFAATPQPMRRSGATTHRVEHLVRSFDQVEPIDDQLRMGQRPWRRSTTCRLPQT